MVVGWAVSTVALPLCYSQCNVTICRTGHAYLLYCVHCEWANLYSSQETYTFGVLCLPNSIVPIIEIPTQIANMLPNPSPSISTVTLSRKFKCYCIFRALFRNWKKYDDIFTIGREILCFLLLFQSYVGHKFEQFSRKLKFQHHAENT